jgi:hypothetical protein
MSPIVLELVRKTLEVTLKMPDDTTVSAELREFDGKQRDAFMNKNKGKTQRIDGKTVEVTDYTGSYSLLLSYTLFNVDAKRYFTEVEIQAWPSSVQERLFTLSRDLNGLKSEEERKASAADGEDDSKN